MARSIESISRNRRISLIVRRLSEKFSYGKTARIATRNGPFTWPEASPPCLTKEAPSLLAREYAHLSTSRCSCTPPLCKRCTCATAGQVQRPWIGPPLPLFHPIAWGESPLAQSQSMCACESRLLCTSPLYKRSCPSVHVCVSIRTYVHTHVHWCAISPDECATFLRIRRAKPQFAASRDAMHSRLHRFRSPRDESTVFRFVRSRATFNQRESGRVSFILQRYRKRETEVFLSERPKDKSNGSIVIVRVNFIFIAACVPFMQAVTVNGFRSKNKGWIRASSFIMYQPYRRLGATANVVAGAIESASSDRSKFGFLPSRLIRIFHEHSASIIDGAVFNNAMGSRH